MGRPVVCFLPGDYRPVPNELGAAERRRVRCRADGRAPRARPRAEAPRPLPHLAGRRDRRALRHRRPDDRPVRALGLRTAHDRRCRRSRRAVAPRVQLRRHVAGPRRIAQHGRVPHEPRTRAQPAVVEREPTSRPTSGSWTRSTPGCVRGRSTTTRGASTTRRRRSSRAWSTTSSPACGPSGHSRRCSVTPRWA